MRWFTRGSAKVRYVVVAAGLFAGVAVVPLGGTAGAATGPTCAASCQSSVTSDANWILANQDPSGWIGMAPPTTTVGLLIQPYSAAYAAIGLSDAYGLDGNSVYDTSAWSWLVWDKQQMLTYAPTTSNFYSKCTSSNVATLESATKNISCFYTPAYCANLAAGVVFHPYGSSDPRTCTGVSGQDYAPVVQPYANSNVTHPYTDSTDATAGLFLVALQRAYQNDYFNAATQQSNPAGALANLQVVDTVPSYCPASTCGSSVIGDAVTAIHSTLDTDGLTWAQPWYTAKYLEDQSESYAGLTAAASLEAALAASVPTSSAKHKSDVAIENEASSMAAGIQSAVSQLWTTTLSTGGPGYGWAKFPSGVVQQTNWTNPTGSATQIYADPQQNAWAVMWGLATGTNATSILSTFDASYGPNATSDTQNWNYPTPTGAYPSPLYWVGIMNATAGDVATAVTAVNDENATYVPTRIWQYQPEDAGLAIWAESLTGA